MFRFRMQTQQDKLQALLEIQDSDPPPASAMPASAPALGASWVAPAAPGLADQQHSYSARTASWAQVLSNQLQQAHGPETGNSRTPFGTVSSQAITPASSQPLAPASSTSSGRSGKPSPFQSAAMAQLLSQGSGVLSERQCAELAANAPGAVQQQQHPRQEQQRHQQQEQQQQEQRRQEQPRQQVRQTGSSNATANGQQTQQSQQQQEQQRQEQKQERQHDQHQQDRRQYEQPVLQPAGPSRHLAVLRSIQACDDGFWKIRWKDLEPGLVKKLGSGSYGQVYQGVYLNAEVAIKVLNIDWDDTPGHGPGYGFSSDVLECFKQEVDFQRKLSFHPNVVRFVGACCEIPEAYLQDFSEGYSLACVPPEIARGVKLAIVMELCHLGSLYSMIAQARRTRVDLENGADIADVRRLRPYGLQFYKDWITRLEVARGAAAGVEYMHQHGVVHRDLTSYNLLLDFGKPWHVKVCDFNLSRMILDGRQLVNSGNPNSPGWQSPEMLAGRPYSKEADVFSFGVLLWEIVTLKEPWREETEGRQAGAPLYYIINSVTTGSRLSFPEPSELDLPEAAEIVQLAQQCWCHHPIERPTMSEVGMRLRDIIQRLKSRRRASSDGSIAGGSMRNSGLLRGGMPQALPTGSQQ